MRNPGLEEAQAGVKIARRNINNLRYTDDTTLMAESEDAGKNTELGFPCPPLGDLPYPGIRPRSPTLQVVDSLPSEPPGKPSISIG